MLICDYNRKIDMMNFHDFWWFLCYKMHRITVNGSLFEKQMAPKVTFWVIIQHTLFLMCYIIIIRIFVRYSIFWGKSILKLFVWCIQDLFWWFLTLRWQYMGPVCLMLWWFTPEHSTKYSKREDPSMMEQLLLIKSGEHPMKVRFIAIFISPSCKTSDLVLLRLSSH